MQHECIYCPYHSTKKINFIKHCHTKKHCGKVLGLSDNINQYIYYECIHCNYFTADVANKLKHEISAEHAFISHQYHECLKEYKCDKCDTIYKHRASWSRHIKNCNKETIMTLLKTTTEMNSKLCDKIVQLETNHNIIKNTIVNNTINNNKLNVHLYLNNECKNAMNLTDFVDKITLSLEDLIYTTENGYIEGITNIFIKNLKGLEPNERPIHSVQDKKKHQLYIKDAKGWECDKKDKQLDSTINSVSAKQFHQIKNWEASRPNWSESEEGIDEYMKIVKLILGGESETEVIHNKRQIKRNIKETVQINI